MVNSAILKLFDIPEGFSLKSDCFKIKKENVYLGNAEFREDQIVEYVRDNYEKNNDYVLGGYQEKDDSTVINYLVYDPKVAHDTSDHFITPYVYSVECIDDIEILEDVLEAYPESLLQAIIEFKEKSVKYYYLILKDLEYFPI